MLARMWTQLIKSRPTERSGLAAWYQAVLAEQARSGVSVDEAASVVGVTATTLYAWRRRLGPPAPAPDLPAPGLVRVRVRRSPESAPLETEKSPKAGILLHLGAGRSVEVASSFDVDALRRLIGALESC